MNGEGNLDMVDGEERIPDSVTDDYIIISKKNCESDLTVQDNCKGIYQVKITNYMI